MPPFRLVLTVLLAAGALAGSLHASIELGARQMVKRSGLAAVDSYMHDRMRELRIPGLALGIVQGDQIVHLKGFGVADPAGRSVTPQTPFILGSVSKSLTALAIMQLVERRKVDLDAPVRRYLPWFRLADERASALITVRHLLTHTAGLPRSADGQTLYLRDTTERALERRVRQLSGITVPSAAGTTYEYTNADFNILGLVVEAVSGKPFGDYLQGRIFTPLDMRHSATSPVATLALATGYRHWLGWPVPAHMPAAPANLPSGFIIASAEDMTHLIIAHLNGGCYAGRTILSAGGIDALQQSFPTGPNAPRAGIAWDVIEARHGATILAKDGATASFHARVVLIPGARLGVVVLANAFENGGMARFNTLADGVAALLFGSEPPARLPANELGPMRPALVGAVALALLVALWSLRASWRPDLIRYPHTASSRRSPRSAWWRVAGSGLWALAILASPRLMGMTLVPFLYDYSPDIFWLLVALAGIPLCLELIKTGSKYGARRDGRQSTEGPRVIGRPSAGQPGTQEGVL